MDDRDWVLIDVETAGLSSPVVVEVAAQRMRGWAPQGPAWRRLINHGPDMNQDSSRIHGISRAVIERDGDPVLIFFAIAEKAQIRVLDLQGTLRHACSHVDFCSIYNTRARSA